MVSDNCDSRKLTNMLWMNLEKRHVVASTNTTLLDAPYVQKHCRTVNNNSNKMEFKIPVRMFLRQSYITCAQMDRQYR